MFSNLNLKLKLILGFTLIALIAGSIGIAGISSIHYLSRQISSVESYSLFSNSADDSLENILQHRRHEKDFFLNLAAPSRKAEALAAFRSSAAELEKKLLLLKKLSDQTPELSAAEREMIAGLPDKHRGYLEGFGKVVAASEADSRLTPLEADQLMLPNKHNIYELESAIMKVKIKGDELAERMTAASVRKAARTLGLLYGAVLGGLLAAVTLGIIVSARITRPLAQITTAAEELRLGNCDVEITHVSGDELGVMAESFRQMLDAQRRKVEMAAAIAAGDLDAPLELASDKDTLGKALRTMTSEMKNYIKNLTEVTAAKERIQSELKVATDIQASLLPRVFPPFPEREEFELFASMDPAKEVGGDFYDFFLVDGKNLCFLIADVSDKGVPAALYMMVAKTLLKTEALRGLPPDEILFRVNNLLAPDNDTCMFVTVFCAILDTESGMVRFANAGHNPPLICRSGESFDYLTIKAGFVLGPVADSAYVTETVALKENDIFFLYTDGVTEAKNPASELFGEKRLQSSLNKADVTDLANLVHTIRSGVELHASGAPQSDDVTMLAIRFRGKAANA